MAVGQDNVGINLGVFSLIAALIAYVPSAAAFTPAILLSFIALLGALITALVGVWRIALVTAWFVGAAVIANPMFLDAAEIARVDYLLVVMAVLGLFLAIALYADYVRRERDA